MSQGPQTPTVLLVEDEPLIQHLIETTLADAGFRVLVAHSAHQAMAILDGEGAAVAGLVSDIDLGDGLRGWDVARHGRQLNPSLAVVYMSGGSPHEWEAEGVPKSDILGKPFVPAQLIVALASQLNQSPAATSQETGS